MRIALPTCSNLPDWEVDDYPFHQALVDAGISFERPIWDDPKVDWNNFDAVLIRTTWDYQEKQPQFVRWARDLEGKTRLINPIEIIEWNTRKTYLRDLEELGAPLTPSIWLERGTQVVIEELMQERGWSRGFLKPVVGATARETLPFDDSVEGLKAAAEHLERLLPDESMILQPFFESVKSEGEYSAIYFGGELSHGVQKIPVPGDYRVQDDFGATDRPHTFSDADFVRVEAILEALDKLVTTRFSDMAPLLYARVDLLRDGAGHLCLNELELVEPSLFFRHDPGSPARLVKALQAYLS